MERREDEKEHRKIPPFPAVIPPTFPIVAVYPVLYDLQAERYVLVVGSVIMVSGKLVRKVLNEMSDFFETQMKELGRRFLEVKFTELETYDNALAYVIAVILLRNVYFGIPVEKFLRRRIVVHYMLESGKSRKYVIEEYIHILKAPAVTYVYDEVISRSALFCIITIKLYYLSRIIVLLLRRNAPAVYAVLMGRFREYIRKYDLRVKLR